MILAAWLAVKAFGKSAWRFLGTPLGSLVLRVAICVALVVCGELHGFSRGVQHEKDAQAKRLEAAKKKVVKIEGAGKAITADVSKTLIKINTEIQWRTRVQLKEVVRYVPVESDRACVVGLGAVSLHQHAFSGLPGLPAIASGSEQAPSGVPLSDLISDDIEFAGTAYQWRAEAVAWRTWYERQAELHNKNIARP